MCAKDIISVLAVSVLSISAVFKAEAQFMYTPDTVRSLYAKDTLNICVMGDMMMHSAQITDAEQRGFETYFMHLRDRISAADIAIANMEYTLAGEPFTGYPSFSAPDGYGEYLADCGFDIFLCANNHIFDKGCRGAERTIGKFRELKKRHGIRYCGIASDYEDMSRNYPLFITSKGIRIALVNMTYGTNLGADRHWPKVNYMRDTTSMKAALKKAEDADFTLALPHWGTEYELLHSAGQRQTAEWLASNGADMIIGTHPHVAQDFDMIDGIQIAYSLGNAVSNMSAPNTQLELMATVRIVRCPNGDLEIMPIEFTWLWCSRPGGYCDSYSVLPVEEFINRKHEWKGKWDYEKMIATYGHVRKTTGIQ